MTIQTNTQQVNNNPPLYAMGQTAVEQPNQQVGSTLQTPADGSNNYVYNYPTTSIYKKPDSGVTIQIFNPSAIGAPNSTSVASANYPQPYFPSIPLPVISQPNTNTNINNTYKHIAMLLFQKGGLIVNLITFSSPTTPCRVFAFILRV